MFLHKSVEKARDFPPFEQKFGGEMKRLDALSSEQLKDLLHRVDKHCRQVEAEAVLIRHENKTLLDDFRLFEEQLKVLAQANVELHVKVNSADFATDVSELLQISFANTIEKLGGKAFISFTQQLTALRHLIATFSEEVGQRKSEVASREGGAGPLADRLDHFSSEIDQKFKIINANVGVLDDSCSLFLKNLQALHLSCSQQDEEGMLEKYLLTDLFLCSKKKLLNNNQLFAKLKKNLTVQKLETDLLAKRLAGAEADNAELRRKLAAVQSECAELQRERAGQGRRSSNENELTGHMSVLQLLQQEQLRLNLENQALKGQNEELRKQAEESVGRAKVLADQLNDLNSSSISSQRQDKLRIAQSKNDVRLLEEKLESTEQMLESENKKYEALYHKYRQLKESHVRQVQVMEEAKRVGKSFDGKASEESDRTLKRRLDCSESLNESGQKQGKAEGTGADGKRREAERAEQLQEELEDLQFRVLTSEYQIATERRIFDEWVEHSEAEKRLMENVRSTDHRGTAGADRGHRAVLATDQAGNAENELCH